MAEKKRRSQYDREEIREFLETIKSDIKKANRGGKVDIRDTCKAFNLGQSSSIKTLVDYGCLEKIKGGTKNWKWIHVGNIDEVSITFFIQGIMDYNKSLDKYKKTPAPEKSNSPATDSTPSDYCHLSNGDMIMPLTSRRVGPLRSTLSVTCLRATAMTQEHSKLHRVTRSLRPSHPAICPENETQSAGRFLITSSIDKMLSPRK